MLSAKEQGAVSAMLVVVKQGKVESELAKLVISQNTTESKPISFESSLPFSLTRLRQPFVTGSSSPA